MCERAVGSLIAITFALFSVGQAEAQVTRTSGWTVRVAPHADLWYHAMSILQLPSSSALPTYDREHLRAIDAAKREAGVYPTALDKKAAAIREDFVQYPSFAALHLVPGYFPDATPERMVAALLGAVDGEDAGQARPDVALGLAIVGRLFSTSREREAFKDFVELVEEEWLTFYQSYWEQTRPAAAAMISEAQRVVDAMVESSIGTTLVRWHLQRGTMFLSAPIGTAGRIYVGDPMNPSDNVVIVRRGPLSTSATASALSLIRELCVPQMQEAVSSFEISLLDEYEATRAWSRAAVLCGERLIEHNAPEYAQWYRDAFVETARGMSPVEFAEVFAIDSRLDGWIDHIIGN